MWQIVLTNEFLKDSKTKTESTVSFEFTAIMHETWYNNKGKAIETNRYFPVKWDVKLVGGREFAHNAINNKIMSGAVERPLTYIL